MEKCITYVGLDVHKNSIAVAFAEGGCDSEVRSYGTIDSDLASLEKVARKLVSRGSEPRFVYEAGPCGYEKQDCPGGYPSMPGISGLEQSTTAFYEYLGLAWLKLRSRI
jgi:hypothetical protein